MLDLKADLGIERITIDLPFRLNHVHCFLAEGKEGWKVIDTGLHNNAAIEAWENHIKNKKITDIIITHFHPDHIGYAGQMQKETGARVWMTKVDANTSQSIWTNETKVRTKQQFKECGLYLEDIEKIVEDTPLIFPLPNVTKYIEDGDRIVFGKMEYEVIYTPGHAEGLFCLYNKEKKMLLSTDHVLPKITPNIMLRTSGDQNPLATFFDSLSKIKKLDIEMAIPSHGQPFINVKNRIEEIEKHHMIRLEQLTDIISNPKTAIEVCQRLFTRQLSHHELRFAVGETLSHLQYLVLQGKCTKRYQDGMWYYSNNSF